MNPANIEEVIRVTLCDYSSPFQISREDDGDCVTWTILPASTDGQLSATRKAFIATTGVEMFTLSLDNLYELREFDWREDGQTKFVQSMSRLAALYLQGKDLTEQRDGWLRRKVAYVMEMGGAVYLFSAA